MYARPLALAATAALLGSCAPHIPQYAAPAADLPARRSPALQPCALVHLEVDEDLSNGARGWFRGPWRQAYSSFVLRQGDRVVLIDAGLGETTPADVDAAPWWFRLAVGNAARPAVGLAKLLKQAGIRPEQVTHVLLTHRHWDHTGGLRELPNARIVMARADAEATDAQSSPFADGAMRGHFQGLQARIDRMDFDGPPLFGFAASRDVFGDGSVIAVPTPGHTPGATSYLVQADAGKPWFFIGDAAWVKEGFEEPVPKGRLASAVADFDADQTADTLGHLHALHALGVAHLVTAHDARTWVQLPRCVSGAATP
ncbi:MAG: MBL fold metallo-hydrolase [Deltaproteobacteria bacterium]|nr:MBL fold metallo-hydrolase [Deltaproteobacteria bacterium]